MYAFFPIEWNFGDKPTDGIGGSPVDDAGTVYVVRDETNEDDYPNGDFSVGMMVLKTSIGEMVGDCVDGWRGLDGFTVEEHVSASDALAAALRLAADRLDAAKSSNQN